MGNASFHPSWWTEQKHGGAWERVKEAMKRDLEQTKNDFTPGAPDLDQDVGDTINQATGRVAIPRPDQKTPPSKGEAKSDMKHDMKQGMKQGMKQNMQQEMNPAIANSANTDKSVPKSVAFDEVESPLSYGYAARMQYASKYPTWNDKLETTLRDEWTAGNPSQHWDDIAPYVRRGFDAPHKK